MGNSEIKMSQGLDFDSIPCPEIDSMSHYQAAQRPNKEWLLQAQDR
jgi:hypothetical protein